MSSRRLLALLTTTVLVLTACGAAQTAPTGLGTAAPSHADYHALYQPHDRLTEPNLAAVRVMAAMEPVAGAKVLDVYLNNGSDSELATYRKIVTSVPRSLAGKLIDNLAPKNTVTGLNELGPEFAPDLLYYVSEETYRRVAGDIVGVKPIDAAVAARSRPDPTKGEGPAGWQRVAGAYQIESIGGKPMPYTYPGGGTIRTMSTTLMPDGRFLFEVLMVGMANSTKVAGIYHVEGDKVTTIHTLSGVIGVSVVKDGLMTSTGPGDVYVLRMK
jgi:hypothetical protein